MWPCLSSTLLPCIASATTRRSLYACTARTVDRSERSWNAEAKAALKKEWYRLRACGEKGCWDESNPRERSDVESEARKRGQVAHFGIVFDICVEKNHHLPAGSPGRKFKGRAVYQGNNVRDQDGNWAIFQDLASCPSTMAASKVADYYSLSPGHDGEQADAEMAYTQAEFHGPTTWVGIPKEQWPSNWYDAKGKPKYRFPVCKLMKALYGHPDSGGLWEKHCDAHLQSIGFKEIASWRSVYFHDELRVLLVVYVDDFKMAGPKKGLCEAWRRIRLKIKVEDPTPFGLFLGCRHEIGEVRLGTNGPKVRTMTYNVESYLQKSLDLYISLLPQGARLKLVPTPFLTTPCGDDINAPFTTGPSLTCPWCRGCFPESLFSKGSAQSKRTRHAACGSSYPACADEIADPPTRGALADKAASVLKQVLYAARYARFDLLCAVSRLAQKITKWTTDCDLALHRLMSYIHSTLQYRMIGYVGDTLCRVRVHVYVDADFAGDPSTKRSTTGVHLCLRGSSTYFPVNGQSKRQACVRMLQRYLIV